jgi:hypothetical protein
MSTQVNESDFHDVIEQEFSKLEGLVKQGRALAEWAIKVNLTSDEAYNLLAGVVSLMSSVTRDLNDLEIVPDSDESEAE